MENLRNNSFGNSGAEGIFPSQEMGPQRNNKKKKSHNHMENYV